MAKTNRFRFKELDKDIITIEEERKYRSPLALFFIKNGKLIFAISCLFSVTIFIIAVALTISNIGESSVVMYESNGVKVTFDTSDNSILNGTPITGEYANKVFDTIINSDTLDVGVVIKLNEKVLKDKTIVFYSDKTALIKYKSGEFSRVFPVNGNYGIDEDGIINKNANVVKVSGKVEKNNRGISILNLSDGSVEISKGNDVFFVRNNDVFVDDKLLYTNLSGVSLPFNDGGKNVFYSDGTVRTDNYIEVDNKKYYVKDRKKVLDNVEIVYYENGYAEIIYNDLSVMVRNSDHIVYNESIIEIVDNTINGVDIKNIMDVKEINLDNTNTEAVHYIVVLEETNNYEKHNVSKRLDNKFINFNTYINGEKKYNNVLDNNLKDNPNLEGLSSEKNTYLLCEGSIDKLSSISIKLGLWVSYEKITNEYMNSAFIGTVKVYVESLS